MFGSFGWMELLLILFIVLIIFGAGKLPQLGEGVGKAIKGFKRSVNEPDATADDAIAQREAPPDTRVQPESLGVPPPTPNVGSSHSEAQESTPRQT